MADRQVSLERVAHDVAGDGRFVHGVVRLAVHFLSFSFAWFFEVSKRRRRWPRRRRRLLPR